MQDTGGPTGDTIDRQPQKKRQKSSSTSSLHGYEDLKVIKKI